MTQDLVAELVIEPGNIHEDDTAELDELLGAFLTSLPEVATTVARRDDEGYGVPWLHVLHFWLSVDYKIAKDVYDNIVNTVVGIIIGSALRRSAREREAHSDKPRAIYRDLYGPDGALIKAVRVEPDGSLIDITEDEREKEARSPRRRPRKD